MQGMCRDVFDLGCAVLALESSRSSTALQGYGGLRAAHFPDLSLLDMQCELVRDGCECEDSKMQGPVVFYPVLGLGKE